MTNTFVPLRDGPASTFERSRRDGAGNCLTPIRRQNRYGWFGGSAIVFGFLIFVGIFFIRCDAETRRFLPFCMTSLQVNCRLVINFLNETIHLDKCLSVCTHFFHEILLECYHFII